MPLALQPCNKVFPLELVATNKAVESYTQVQIWNNTAYYTR